MSSHDQTRLAALRQLRADATPEWAKGKKFKHPKTRNDVGFGSLPADEQAKIRSKNKGKSEGDGDDKGGKPKSTAEAAKSLNSASSDPAVGKAIKDEFGDEQVSQTSAMTKAKRVGKFIAGGLVGSLIGAVGLGLGGPALGAVVLGVGLLNAFANEADEALQKTKTKLNETVEEGREEDWARQRGEAREKAKAKTAASVKLVDLVQKGLKNVKPADIALAKQFSKGDKFDTEGFMEALKKSKGGKKGSVRTASKRDGFGFSW